MASEENRENTFLLFGPPGTGKTTFLAGSRHNHVVGQVERAVDAYGAQNVLVCSFTKAAAHEIGSRVEGLPDRNIGTLHSVCFHALGCPELTEGNEESFNKVHPNFALTIKKRSGKKKKKSDDDGEKTPASSEDHSSRLDDPFQDGRTKTMGDKIREEIDLLRVRRVPTEKWVGYYHKFHSAWTEWKRDNELMDFTDLLERSIEEFDEAPGEPAALFYDEAQDASQLQADLLAKWGVHLRRLILAGDDDQAIFFWAGADSRSFLDFPCEAKNRRYLKQSYRLPRAVHEKTQSWVRRLDRREAKQFEPRDADGFVDSCFASWTQPEQAVCMAEQFVSDGKSVMFLASCSYMLEPLKAILRKRGLPFANPWRQSRGDWNPLASGLPAKVMPVDRLRAFLKPDPDVWGEDAGMWRKSDAAAWLSPLEIEQHFLRGVKTRAMKEWKKDPREVNGVLMAELLSAGTLEQWFRLAFDDRSQSVESLRWWLAAMPEEERSKLTYQTRVFEQRGGPGLNDRPLITIGTGHSLKGAEADVCFVFPDLSKQGFQSWIGDPDGHDGIIRLFYVMMTRAKDGLYLCRPSSMQHVGLAA